MFESILYQTTNGTATIKFNRPDQGNAFASETYDEIIEAMERADADEQVKSIILTGVGKHFCAGGDIGEFSQLLDQGKPIPEASVLKTGDMIKSVLTNRKPVIAAVNGVAAGAGLGLALACDFILMAESSQLHTAFVRMAFPGDTGLIYSLQKAIGTFKAKEHVMLGTPITADLAAQYGLIYQLVPDGELESASENLAKQLNTLSGNALKLQKELFAEMFYPELDHFNALEAKTMHQASQHPDHFDAVKSFLKARQ